MKPKIVIAAFLFLISCSPILAQKSEANAFNSAKLHTLQGEYISLQNFLSDDGVNLLVFWATWCSPCITELNIIAELYGDWTDTYNVNIIAISVDDNREKSKLAPFINGKRWPFKVLHDSNQEVMRLFGFSSVPSCVIMNSSGKIIWQKIGFLEGDEYTIQEKLQ